MGGTHESSKLNPQTIETYDSQACIANEGPLIKADSKDVLDGKRNMPPYFKSSVNRAADKVASEMSTN